MKKIVILALLTLPFLFSMNTPIPGMSGSSQSLRSFPTQEKQPLPDPPTTLNKNTIMAKAMSIAVPFVKNVGQFDGRVNYAADLFAGRFFLTDKELVYSLFKRQEKKGARPDRFGRTARLQEKLPGKGLVFKEFFVDQKGAKIDLRSMGEEQAETLVSYFKGSDPGQWRSGVASYQSVSLGEVYPGIEVKLKGSGKNVEKIFFVSPAGNVADIRIGISGITGIKIGNDGKLILKNSLGDLAMRAPVAWQEIEGERHDVNVGYRLLGKNLYGFFVCDGYDAQYPLIIDPDLDTLLASTFLGGNYSETVDSLVLDNSGNVYLSGSTSSLDFPVTAGTYDQTHNGGYNDVFVAKFSCDLTRLLASTFLGGNDMEWNAYLAIDGQGNIYLAGNTESADFPTTPGAYERINKSGDLGDAYVSKLNSDLNELLASTFLGGTNSEVTSSVLALDSADAVYLSGRTLSADFPTIAGAYDRIYDGSNNHDNLWYWDAFVSKLNNDLSILLASTYFGGSLHELGFSLALDGSGNVYLAGSTSSTNFPTTSLAYQQTLNGNFDACVAKLDRNLSHLLASTYLGGGLIDGGESIALDSAGNVYLAGETGSGDFPATPGAYAHFPNGGLGDIFISKLDNSFTSLLASTFLGGSFSERVSALALDGAGNVCLTGITGSKDFPTTPRAYNRIFYAGYNSAAFVSKLDHDLTSLLVSTYLGGSQGAFSTSLAIDGSENIFLAGHTYSSDFPTTTEAFAPHSISLPDAFIAKLGTGGFFVDLQAERREVRAVSILRYYGQLQFHAGNPAIEVAQYRIMRRKGTGGYILLKTVAPSELQNNQFQLQDKYLDKGVPYTYRVEAYNAAGELVGRSAEKTI